MSLENEWKNTCRLCAEIKSDMLKIYGDEGKKRKIADKLRVCIPVLVYKTDPLPKNICQFCAARLDDIYEFREYCLTVYKKMYIKLKKNKNDKTVSIYLNTLNNNNSSDKFDVKSRAPLPILSANNNNNNNNTPGYNGHSEGSEASLNKLTDEKIQGDKSAFKQQLAGLPCQVEIKEEPMGRQHVDDMLLLDDDEGDGDDNNFNQDDEEHNYHSEFNNISNNYNGESEDLNYDDKSEYEKRTSILEQALTGILSVNESKEAKIKLTSEWWCSPCNSYFKTKESLMKHMQLSCPRSYTCGKCSRVFKSVEELAKHEGTDHLKVTLDFDETMKECHQCDREFVSWEMLRHHRMRDHVGCSLELGTSTWCQICNRFFPNVEVYKNHLELHVDEKEHQIIETTLGEELFDEQEVVPVHDIAEDRKKEHFIKSIKSLTCPTCGKVCTQQSALSNHMRTHEPKKHKCDECGRSFGLLIRLETHRLSEHNHQQAGLTSVEQEEALNAEREAKEARMKGTRCRKYSETLDTDELLTDNLPAPKKIPGNVNSLKNVARCGICQQWFTDHTTMLTHLQTHSDNFVVKNFSCNTCKKSFKEKWQLQRHEMSHKRKKGLAINPKDIYEKTHVVDKTYHCPKCNKIFFKEFSLMTHQCSPIMGSQKNSGMDKIKSTGDCMKFKCSKCGACFNSSQSRNSHMKIHAESKKVKKKVEEMPKLLPDMSPSISMLLEPKIEIQEQEPPPPVKRTLIKTANGYRCGVCQSPFVLRELAVAHLRSAHPVMPYQCPYCKKRFTTQYTFSHHIKEDHPDDSEK